MEFNLEVPQDALFVRSLGEKGIRVGDDYINKALILSEQELITDWGVAKVADINEESLQAVFDLQPELVIIGTGEKQVFLAPPVQTLFFKRNIGFEVMTTDAACRTFNVLVTEGRKVVAALLPLTS